MVDSNTLLQTDATVIAGVLVLLTIYSLELPRSNEARGIRKSLAMFIVAAMLPFCTSAILAINSEGANHPERVLQYATFSATVGFGYIITVVVLILIIPLRRRSTEHKKRP
jgi:formate-dependent nitrite reductase membrane component NrfD